MIKLATLIMLSLLLLGCVDRKRDLVTAKARYICKDHGGFYTKHHLQPEHYVACRDGATFSRDRVMRTTIEDPAYYPDGESK